MKASAVVECFNDCFLVSHQTRMLGGAVEPLYQPGQPACLMFREDFAASALHEAAHWCIAGTQRRALTDFGYVYLEGPRDAAAQAAFFNSELKAQALESLFAEAAGLVFTPSADNLGAPDSLLMLAEFKSRLDAQRPRTQRWLAHSADRRAHQFFQALRRRRQAA